MKRKIKETLDDYTHHRAKQMAHMIKSWKKYVDEQTKTKDKKKREA